MSTDPHQRSPARTGRLHGFAHRGARLPGILVVALLRVYQRVVSPLYGPTCRFYPSCSAYAVGSIQVHGILRGTVLAGWRILRCNPWNPGGVDDVPPGKMSGHHGHD